VHSMNANQSAGKVCNVAPRHALVVVASCSVAASWEGIGTSLRKRGNRTCLSGSKSLDVYRLMVAELEACFFGLFMENVYVIVLYVKNLLMYFLSDITTEFASLQC
jgi:hypothetical protein